jgi:DNA-directed RNA polymerase subunit RPC12/RpoP
MYGKSNRSYGHSLREGISAVRRGNKNLAWTLLHQAAELNPLDPTPWLWLTEATDDVKEKIDYLEQALAADPRHYAARRGLAALKGEPEPKKQFSPENFQVQAAAQPVPAQVKEVFLCAKCGAHMEYDLNNQALTCLYCGHSQQTEEKSAADNEQVMADFLPTESGHSWAVSQHQLVCGRCGAHSLWPPGQTATKCPYCGSGQLIESEETEGLVDPQALAIMQVDEAAATKKMLTWLEKGWSIPDDLREQARKSLLRPAYYPFWTFDGTMDIHWSCEVNEGSANRPHWVGRNGVEYEMFDDVLIPGLTSLKFKVLNKLQPFNLKDVVVFKPDFLAGWPALAYDRPLVKATLLAREQIVKRVRPQLHYRVMPGTQKRGLQTGGVNWQDMTFKHVLLPVWIGNYTYRGEDYQVVVNGQTGKVTGDKPRDTFKVVGIIVSVLVTLLVLGLIGFTVAVLMGWL